MRRSLKIAALVGVVLFAALGMGSQMSRVDTPDYVVERADGPIEVRAYPALTVATTIVGGNRGAAVNKGFRTLANYIFGANVGGQKIEMTAPVMQKRDGSSDWAVRFVMPRSRSMSDLPKPQKPDVAIEVISAARFAVIRFSGFWRDALLQQKLIDLEAYIARNKLTSTGTPIFAFYDPPWKLPFFRRNEVIIELVGR